MDEKQLVATRNEIVEKLSICMIGLIPNGANQHEIVEIHLGVIWKMIVVSMLFGCDCGVMMDTIESALETAAKELTSTPNQ